MSRKITVIGAGNVGSTIAYTLSLGDIASEIVLIDINTKKAMGEALDIYQGAPFHSPAIVRSGEYEDAAGSDIVVITCGIARKPGMKRVQLSDLSLVTSGDYQRYYVVDGVEYCHIIDPDTLMPADYFASVSIICDDSGVADALSTSVFNMPFEEGLEFVNGLEGVEAVWIMHDGSIEYSEGFEEYIIE